MAQSEMTKDLIEWCRRERESALSQIAFFTEQGSRMTVTEPGKAPKDITDQTLEENRRIVERMDALITRCENEAG